MMTLNDLLLFTPAFMGLALAWLIAWRVSKTGNSTTQEATRKPGTPAREDMLASR